MTRSLMIGASVASVIAIISLLQSAGVFDNAFTADDLHTAKGWHVTQFAHGYANPAAITTGSDGVIVFVLANGTISALRDVNNDGASDLRFTFASAPADAEITLFLGDLYVRSDAGVSKYPEAEGHIALGVARVPAETFPERVVKYNDAALHITDATVTLGDEVLVRGWRSVFHDYGTPVALAAAASSVYVLDSNGVVWLLQQT